MIELRYLIGADQANNQYIHNQPYKRLQYRYKKNWDYNEWTEWFDIPMVVQGEVYDNGNTAQYASGPYAAEAFVELRPTEF